MWLQTHRTSAGRICFDVAQKRQKNHQPIGSLVYFPVIIQYLKVTHYSLMSAQFSALQLKGAHAKTQNNGIL